jgi:hypothetical protein
MAQDLPARTRLTLASQNKSYVRIDITASGDDDTFAFEREDYKPETMAIANAQAVGITEESRKNKYTLAIGSSIKSLQVNGKPASIEDNGPGGRFTYSDEFQEPSLAKAYGEFINTSNNTSNFDFEIIKGQADKTSENQLEYQALLKEVSNNPTNNKLTENTERLAERAGFNSAKKPYLTIGQKERDTSIGKVTLQNTKGVHSPKNSDASEGNSPPELNLQHLKNLGLQLMLASSGEYVNIMDQENTNQFLAAKAGSLVPGLARLGTKVPVSSLNVQAKAQEANPAFTKSDSSLLYQDDLLSYGSYNNPLVPFDSIDSRSSIAASSILIATLTALFEVLSRVFSPKNGLQSPLAQTIAAQVNNIALRTNADYSECVRVGMQVFFANDKEGLEGIVGGTLENLNEAPGYYNTILRNLVRSITHEVAQQLFTAVVPPGLLDGVTGPFDSNTATNIRPAGVSFDIGSNILNAIRRISQSRVVGFMNVLANIGDIKIAQRLRSTDLTLPNSASDVIDVYETDTQKIVNQAALIRNHRLSNDASIAAGLPIRTLTWAAGSTPSKFILPNSIIVGARDLSSDDAESRIQAAMSRGNEFITAETENRLSDDIVSEIEDHLEASYMPFYFHDLRTNEIISFHAFLTDMQDGFTAEYVETTGYGRIGKVYTYKNTDRSISMGFVVVATNPEDFDRMWWKINRLIMSVYPQYTAGRVLEYDNQKFIQPFSQIPSASPLMRVRLGDVWKSNYSKFGLARLFGLGQGQDKFFMNSQVAEQNRTQEAANIREQIASIRQRMLRGTFEENERFYIYHDEPPTPTRRAQQAASHTQWNKLLPISEEVGLPTGRYLVRVVSLLDSNPNEAGYMVQIDDAPAAIRSRRYGVILRIGTEEEVAEMQSRIQLYDPDILAKARSRASRSRPTESTQELNNTESLVQDFFSKRENPIFKAFESSKGRGLAGFIKSLKFDWNESNWETSGLGRRAPTMIKVSLEFAPIHDITPGIDNNGMMTAPVYGVGEIANSLVNSVESDYTDYQEAKEKYSSFEAAARQRRTRTTPGSIT